METLNMNTLKHLVRKHRIDLDDEAPLYRGLL